MRYPPPSSRVQIGPEVDLSEEFSAHYAGRAVLVTGADGFLGSHLVDALVRLGSRVHALLRPKSGRTLVRIGHHRESIRLHWANLCDRHAVDKAVSAVTATDRRPYVFHFAALSHVGYSWAQPHETLTSNVVGTLNLLQSLVDHGVEPVCFDQAASSEEYGNSHGRRLRGKTDRLDVVFDEDSALDPRSIYGTSKVCQEFLARNYHAAYGLPVIAVRMFNHFGPRQSPDFITGAVINQALRSETITLGDLRPSRDFTYCLDGVRAHLALAAGGKPGEVYTYGNGQGITIGDWAQLIVDIGQSKGMWPRRTIVSDPRLLRPGDTEVLALKVDYRKVNEAVGWKPRITWEDGLVRTIEHYVDRAPALAYGGEPIGFQYPEELTS